MKKNKILVLTVLLLVVLTASVRVVLAKPVSTDSAQQRKSPGENPKDIREEKIKNLKERVATKAAELRLLKKRAISGVIGSLSETGLVVKTKKGEITVETNETTEIYEVGPEGKRKAIKLAGLSKEQKVVVWGQFNSETETLTARQIIARVFPLNIPGRIISLDKNQKSFTVENRKKTVFSVVTDNLTKFAKIERGKGTVKASFADLKEESRVHIHGFLKTKEAREVVDAFRILILPEKMTASPAAVLSPAISPSPAP